VRLAAPAIAVALGLAAPAAAGPSVPHARVLLQGLDKVTARVAPIDAAVDGATEFGTLEILPRACYTTPPTEPPESAAFLEIRERTGDDAGRLIFSGWMFASSPGLSALEHPIYDVWVLGCEAPLEAPPAASPSTTQLPNG
jgi:hypothetical protein